MFEENGRFKPADKKEIAQIAGREMMCPVCGKEQTLGSVEFANVVCECGNRMVDKDFPVMKMAGSR